MDEPTHALNNDAFSVSFQGDSVFEPGQIVGGKYKIVSILGRGGMGTVYRVEQEFLQKEFALKTIDKRQISDIAVRRFQQEAKAASLLDHPNLVQVHDFGLLEKGQPFLVMDLVKGISLAKYLRANGPLTVEQAAQLFTQVCFGLLYAHEQGVIHRDIKPSNIMLTKDAAFGTEGSVRLVDFGIAKITNTEDGEIQALTRTGEIFGSPLYMSPEQCSGGKVDLRSDIYSLGCVLFEALTGAPPHLGKNALATMMLHQSEKALPLKEASLGRNFPESLELIVDRMLQKSPVERYLNLGVVAHHLACICSDGAPAEIRTARSAKERPARMISMTLTQLSLLLLASSLSAAMISAAVVSHFRDKKSMSESQAVFQNHGNKASSSPKGVAVSDNGILDGFVDLKMEKLSSPRSIRSVIEDDSPKTRSIIFPACGVGRLWNTNQALVPTSSLGEARGSVSIAGDARVTLEVADNVLNEPSILNKVAPDVFFGLFFRNSNDHKPEHFSNDGMKKILKMVSGWANLQSITLDRCSADQETLAAICKLSKLRYLDIRMVKDIDAAFLAEQPLLAHLNGLYASEFKVDQILPKLAGSQNLHYLHLSNTSASAHRLMELRRCPHLEYLGVLETKVNRTDDRAVSAVAQIKSLKVASFGRLSLEQVKLLKRCSWLVSIGLRRSAYTEAERARFQAEDARINFTY